MEITRNTPRIGLGMIAATRFVATHPGCPKLPVAEHVGPHSSRQFGYRIVDRAIRAGLINAAVTSRGYSLTVSADGWAAIGCWP